MNTTRCIIFNPAARGEKAARFRPQLSRFGGYTCLPTTGPGTARDLAEQAVQNGFETIVAAGGDGTLHEVVNGIGRVVNGFAKVRVAVIPLGTVNVFAQEQMIDGGVEQAFAVIERGREIMIDLPQITCLTKHGSEVRFFLQMAGAGLDASAVNKVSWRLKKKVGPMAYGWAAFQALRRHQPVLQLKMLDRSIPARWVIVCNGKFYGGRFKPCPDASYADGLLDVCVFPKLNWLTAAASALALLSNRPLPRSIAQLYQTRQIDITSEVSVPVQADGELLGFLPANLSVGATRLRVVVP